MKSEQLIQIPKDTFKTYTVNRGKEFVCYSKVEADLKVPVYFAAPHSSWSRKRHENTKDLLQENFLKQTDLVQVSDEKV